MQPLSLLLLNTSAWGTLAIAFFATYSFPTGTNLSVLVDFFVTIALFSSHVAYSFPLSKT